MSIHHLSDAGKKRLMQKIFDTLTPEGGFLHAELVLGPTPSVEARYQERWKRHLESTDIGEEELAAIYERMACDRPATLDQQLSWLRTAGFADVDYYFKHYNFTVTAGKKPNAP
jgi:tRNA (cmo5U34)-methyltransferase